MTYKYFAFKKSTLRKRQHHGERFLKRSVIARGQWDEEREEQVEHRGLLGLLSYSEWYCNVDTHHCTLIKALRMCCTKSDL